MKEDRGKRLVSEELYEESAILWTWKLQRLLLGLCCRKPQTLNPEA